MSLNNEELNILKKEIDGLRRDFGNIQQKLNEFESFKEILRVHRHLGKDGSYPFIGDTDFKGKTLTLTGGQRSTLNSSWVVLPLRVVDNTELSGKPKRGASFGVAIINSVGSSEEQINAGIISGLSLETDQNIDFSDFTKLNFAQARLIQLPQNANQPPFAFFLAQRTPLISSSGSITNGGNTLSDSSLNLTTNSLNGCILVLYATDGSIAEAYRISSNTSTVITISGNWTSATGTYNYFVLAPVFLGSAESPWRRLYVGDDIRLSYGSSGGTQVRWIKWGNGSPEGVVTASVGSLYLRFDGGAGSTLYVKESGTGNTGWVAK